MLSKSSPRPCTISCRRPVSILRPVQMLSLTMAQRYGTPMAQEEAQGNGWSIIQYVLTLVCRCHLYGTNPSDWSSHRQIRMRAPITRSMLNLQSRNTHSHHPSVRHDELLLSHHLSPQHSPMPSLPICHQSSSGVPTT